MKQTAVEWLIEQIDDIYIHQIYSKAFEQAIEMEKKQQGYCEEEVQVKLYECLGHFAQKHNIIINGSEIDQWFKQFKNK